MYGEQVTLSGTATVYNLYTLVSSANTNVPEMCHQVTLQSDPSNSASKIYVGGLDMSKAGTVVSHFGAIVVPSGTLTNDSPFNGIDLRGITLNSDTASQLVNVKINVL